MASTARRSPEEIRRSVETTRQELTYSLNDLQSTVSRLTDWRRQLVQNRQRVLIGAAAAGFVVGGGIPAALGIFRRRR